MGLLDAIVKTTAIKAAEKFGESAIESIAKHSSSVLTAHVEKNNLSYVYTPESAEHYRGMDFEEVKKELSAYGFKNINLLERKDLRNNIFFRMDNRKVSKITIAGQTEFKKKAKFLSDAQVVIEYHIFRDKR